VRNTLLVVAGGLGIVGTSAAVNEATEDGRSPAAQIALTVVSVAAAGASTQAQRAINKADALVAAAPPATDITPIPAALLPAPRAAHATASVDNPALTADAAPAALLPAPTTAAPARREAWVVRPTFALYSLVLSLAALSTVLTNLADQLLSSTGWSP
jgi:hypothetical protein